VVADSSKVEKYNASVQLLTTYGTAGIMTTSFTPIEALTTPRQWRTAHHRFFSGGIPALEKTTTAVSPNAPFVPSPGWCHC
jgi:hypothetical protein